METLLGFIALAVVICAVVAAWQTPPAGGATRPPTRPAAGRRQAPPPPRSAGRLTERERQRIGDAAFFDGVIFSHYFLDSDSDSASAEPDVGAGDDYGDFGDEMDDGFYD